jgi:hypothetical protein
MERVGGRRSDIMLLRIIIIIATQERVVNGERRHAEPPGGNDHPQLATYYYITYGSIRRTPLKRAPTAQVGPKWALYHHHHHTVAYGRTKRGRRSQSRFERRLRFSGPRSSCGR